MKKTFIPLLFLFTICSCNIKVDTSHSNEIESMESSISSESVSNSNIIESSSIIDINDEFKIKSNVEGGYTYDLNLNQYRISKAGTYDLYGRLINGQIYVNASDDEKVYINLNGVYIDNNLNSPIFINNADKVEISAKKDTCNYIYDLRNEYEETEDEQVGKSAIYSCCDLEIKGKGYLEVKSNVNNGIHTKDDLKIKNLSLKSIAINNAIKGNDSISVESCNLTAISISGDGFKTTSTSLNKNQVQRGFVSIDSSNVEIYSACDGIDAASDVNISGDSNVKIYTDCYSPYTNGALTNDNTSLYIRLTSTLYSINYYYSSYFYNDDGSYKWVDCSFYKEVSSMPAGPGGFKPAGPGGKTYYYYKVNRPSNFTNMKVYAYNSLESQQAKDDYIASSTSNTTIPDNLDTFIISSLATYNKVISNSGWASFADVNGNNKLDYSCKGIKSGNEINILNGKIDIKTKDDGLHSNFDEVLESTGKVGLGNILIKDGTINIYSDDDAIHADQDAIIEGGTINVSNSYEGLEANRIYIKGGYVTIVAKDDGINANSKGNYSAYVEISGGFIDVSVPKGDTDTIDSNGTIKITGGIVFLKNGNNNGSSMTGGTFDSDRGVSVTGGTVVAIGCIGESFTGATQSTTITLAHGNYQLIDSQGQEIFTFTLQESYKSYIIYSSEFTSGSNYLKKDDTIIVTIKA